MRGQPIPIDQQGARDPLQQMQREDDRKGTVMDSGNFSHVQVPDGLPRDERQVLSVEVVLR